MTDILSEIVAWCPNCKYWIGPEHIGEGCIGGGECQHRLIKRRLFICRRRRDCLCSFPTRKALKAHTCGDCYD